MNTVFVNVRLSKQVIKPVFFFFWGGGVGGIGEWKYINCGSKVILSTFGITYLNYPTDRIQYCEG